MSISSVLIFAGYGLALEADDLDLMEPTIDLDFVVILNDQSKTVTADLNFPGDFATTPVQLIGNGTFEAVLTRTSTEGELIYILLIGFGVPPMNFNINFTPVTLRVNSVISEVDDSATGLLIHGILFSPEEPPYEYDVRLNF
jgi:hypothetical protein